ncbi:MAG TPA: carboxylesterase [Thioalkalivibrio sp.]|nr:carboxylesterase [Thioalkalivibrio sp.]
MTESLEFLTVDTGTQPTACIVWLHGLGADGHDFEPIVPELDLPPDLSVRFLFPHAPVMPVTINGGLAMRAWYDFESLDFGLGENAEHIRASTERVTALIDAQREGGIQAERIIVAGFSQGGVIALHAGIGYRERLGGVLALSTYLPLAEELEARMGLASRGLPVFMAHGHHDEIIPISIGHQARNWLKDRGFALEAHDYPMGHSVCAEEIAAVSHWLRARLG